MSKCFKANSKAAGFLNLIFGFGYAEIRIGDVRRERRENGCVKNAFFARNQFQLRR